MELPIAQESYRPSNSALVRLVKQSALMLGRVVSDEAALTGGTAISNPDYNDIRVANFATEMNLPEGADAGAIVSEITEHFESNDARCLTMDSAEGDWPQPLADAITAAGYARVTKHLFLLGSFQPSKEPPAHQIIPARASFAETRKLYLTMAESEFSMDTDLANRFADAMMDRLDEPRLELFIARVDQQPVALAGVATQGQVGAIVPAYSSPAARGTGAGKAVVSHVLEYCIRAQYEQVLLTRSDGCYTIPFYERLGFEKIASYDRFVAGH